jgi:hypothetical protein
MKDKTTKPKTVIPDFTNFSKSAVVKTISALLKAFPPLTDSLGLLLEASPQLRDKLRPALEEVPELSPLATTK